MRRALLLLVLTACAARVPPRWIVERRVVSGDASLYVRAAGGSDPDARTLIVIHGGWGLSHEYLLGLEPLASSRLRVVFYDQRAVGRSSGTLGPDPMAQSLDDLEAVRRAFGAEHVHVLGHSAGGINAILYTAAHPERVASLILLDSAPLSRNLLEAAFRQMHARIEELVAEKLIVVDDRSPDAHLASILPAYFSDPRHPAARRGLGNARIARGVNARTLAALGDYDLTAQLQAIAVPVLVYFSEVPFGELSGRSPSSALPHALTTLVTWADCGHMPFLECPEKLLPELRAFIGR